ncbi:GNAT family N-acetyltransferase [Umezawaea beigongshangensis]|uniref:GNAT family N-acetyltransferase n=1 Tax=Umezawaea beigongshangensis TaxID=2780383 RepID=UPI0018F1FC54|nr:GNAT family N-acetyltransferase [Umezawaea beigongshangensis]
MELTRRALSPADVPALTALMAAVEAVDRTGEHHSADDVADLLTDPELDLADGTVGVWDGDLLVAFGIVRTRRAATVEHRVWLRGAVHPRHRRAGMGTALLDRLVRSAALLHGRLHGDMPLVLDVTAAEHREDAIALVRRAGFTPQRWFFDMRTGLPHPPAPVAEPDGYRFVPYSRDRDEEVRLVRNAAFADHWGTADATPVGWAQHYTGGASFEPDLSPLALDAAGAVVGFVLSRHFEADTIARGVRELWIADVGTLRAHRGRGVASALLNRAMTDAFARGFRSAGLGVDATNPTGALGVYERAGFTVDTRWVTHSLPVR